MLTKLKEFLQGARGNKDRMFSLILLVILAIQVFISRNEISDLEDDIYHLERKIKLSRNMISEVNTQYIDVDHNLSRLSYDDWQDVLKDIRRNFQNIKNEVDELETKLR